MLLIWLTLIQINQANMGIGREYVDKVRDMDDDEKQELMLVFESLSMKDEIFWRSFVLRKLRLRAKVRRKLRFHFSR